ncbi:hypothetical protein [Lysobacter sp.]|uniref:hypothetical protein n=1 Tax=Lysobacter sp. TaxID=72226 RepID=UPI002D427D22|nr:hypothetical protein [Lysobacter sp.]HZX77401.1 hypothetical protein [Lysobacter sp.]
MNTTNDRRPDPPHDAGWRRHDEEWRAQERALQQERRGLPLDPADSRLAEYRLIARALRTPAMEPLPFDLAAQIVQRVADAQMFGERVERWLLRGLMGALVVAAMVVVDAYGASWWPAFAALWPASSTPSSDWSVLVVACLAISALWQLAMRFAAAPGALRRA